MFGRYSLVKAVLVGPPLVTKAVLEPHPPCPLSPHVRIAQAGEQAHVIPPSPPPPHPASALPMDIIKRPLGSLG
jgi:hypothetical protein